MDLQPWALYLSILTITILLILKSTARLSRRRLNLPPGPNPWPIIGNLNLIGPLPHRSIHHLSLNYGPIMHLRFGSVPVVVGSSVDAARFFLKTHDVVFASRPETAASKYTAYDSSDITWSPYSTYWRQARKLCLVELFSAKRIDQYEHIRAEERRRLLQDLFRSSNEPLILKDSVSTLSSNVISRMILGKNYVGEEEGAAMSPEEYKRMLDEFFLLSGVPYIGDSIPWLDFLDLQGYVKRMKAMNKKFDGFLEHVLAEHEERRKEEGERFVAKDLVDLLLQVADDPQSDLKMSRDNIKAVIQDLLTGGTESTAVTIEWTISELLKQPHIFEKAIEELDRVVGRDRWVDEQDILDLPYIESIMKEAMRMHPVAPMLVPRLSSEATAFAGYDIPAGCRVLVNVWTIGRDPSVWDEPDEFQPERFLGKEIDVRGHDFELLPFGAGRRMCPAYNLGLKVILTALANLLHGFLWELPEGMKIEALSMEELFGLSTTKKVPLEVVVVPRLETRLYEG